MTTEIQRLNERIRQHLTILTNWLKTPLGLGYQFNKEVGKNPVQSPSNRFLKLLTEETTTTEVGSLVQYQINLTEKAGVTFYYFID